MTEQQATPRAEELDDLKRYPYLYREWEDGMFPNIFYDGCQKMWPYFESLLKLWEEHPNHPLSQQVYAEIAKLEPFSYRDQPFMNYNTHPLRAALNARDVEKLQTYQEHALMGDGGTE